MTGKQKNEVIIVRSLTDSDLGLFAAHRQGARSKSRQRAININAPIAKLLLSPELFTSGEATLDCICAFNGTVDRAQRHLGKVQKNWRLGGNMIEGPVFGLLDSKDFILIRSTANNDGTQPVILTFVSRTTDKGAHARLVRMVQQIMRQSMAFFKQDHPEFPEFVGFFPILPSTGQSRIRKIIPSMPRDEHQPLRTRRNIRDRIRSPHLMEQMLKVAGDLSAPAQLRFLDTVEQLASQLRTVLLETGAIVHIQKDHHRFWKSVAGQAMGFIDGGLANLSMLGSAPIAARVGGYIVRPGDMGPNRERFLTLRYLIDELYAGSDSGVFNGLFPDLGALRDAARISVEAAGAVHVLQEQNDLVWLFMHGALVNPVSRYTDVMRNGRVKHRFPDFSSAALQELLPPADSDRNGRDANFISVHLRQMEILSSSKAIVCSVVERESTSITVCRTILQNLDERKIASLLPLPPAAWRDWFIKSIDPSEDEEGEGQRISDSLLFRCVLEPGEAILPVEIDRNELRRAPEAWKSVISRYPKPWVSYLLPTEWSAPIRLEMFRKDTDRFDEVATLVLHCALLLPHYAFPAGLDIVDKYARIPDWMSRPVNTHTAVQAMKRALDHGDKRLFDTLRRMLCGSSREWLLRPGINS
jgi:hypothetical protein